MRVAVPAVLLTVALAAPARADRWDGAGSLEYEAGYLHSYESDDGADSGPDAPDGLGLAGARLRGQLGKTVGYRVGLDLRAGMTRPAGFAYDVSLYAVGVGLRLGDWTRFGITAGVGASGATGTVDDAAQFPIEAMLELPTGSRLRILARGRVAWLAASDPRQSGAPTLPFGDELEAQLAIRLGHRRTHHAGLLGNGYFVGVGYREAQGTRMLGAVIGHSIDMASPRKQ